MKRLLGFVLAASLVLGCKPEAHRMAGALPVAAPIFQVIPAGANPNTLGIPGAQGTRLQNSGGVGAWDMGPNGVWIVAPPLGTADGGAPLSSIAATAPLGGNGTAGSPLTISNANPDAGGAMTATQYNQFGLMYEGCTAKIDLTAASATYSFGPSALKFPGFYFVGQRYNFVFTSLTGTSTTGLTFGVGNDGSNVNVVASSALSTTTLNTAAGIGAPILASNTAAINVGAIIADTTTEVKFKVITPVVTGGTAVARLCMVGQLVPAP